MIKGAKKLKKSISNPEKEEDQTKADPESVMVLGLPWNYMRDVVMDLPVFDEDATFLWETRDSSGPVVKKMLQKCFDLPLEGVSFFYMSLFFDALKVSLKIMKTIG